MRIIKALKSVNYRLLLAIFATMLLPTVYQTVRIYFLGDMPNDWGVNIASQLSWVNLFYEVVQEALILPLFFLLGKSLQNKDNYGACRGLHLYAILRLGEKQIDVAKCVRILC